MAQPNSKQKVLVTGGASGLGRAFCHTWAKAGADICLVDIHVERGNQVVEEIKALGVDCFYQQCDITQDEQIDSLKQAVLNRWQRLDLVVNNAGIASADSLADESMALWRKILEINLLGAVQMTKAFAPVFAQQNQGHFLNVASQAGVTPIPMMASYNVSKAALVSFSETMRLELASENIGVSVLCPGFFKTNLSESLQTTNEGLRLMLDKMMARATLTAEAVAAMAYRGVANNDFLILSHAEGKMAMRLKRWLPKVYLKMMTKKTANLVKKTTL